MCITISTLFCQYRNRVLTGLAILRAFGQSARYWLSQSSFASKRLLLFTLCNLGSHASAICGPLPVVVPHYQRQVQPNMILPSKSPRFEETFENTKWRKVKQMQPLPVVVPHYQIHSSLKCNQTCSFQVFPAGNLTNIFVTKKKHVFFIFLFRKTHWLTTEESFNDDLFQQLCSHNIQIGKGPIWNWKLKNIHIGKGPIWNWKLENIQIGKDQIWNWKLENMYR